jgi:hypothetical protein
MWTAYADDDPDRVAAGTDANAAPGLAPPAAAGLDPVELVVDGERFVVTRRAGAPGTYDFAWVTHPASYGFSVGGIPDWKPDPVELIELIRDFLVEIDPETGYLRD